MTGKRWTKLGWLLFYIYIIVLSYFLFFSVRYGRSLLFDEYRYNLELLKEIKRFLYKRDFFGFEIVAVNILGNILAFMPFGFMLPLLNRRYRGFFRMAFLSILFSLTIETLQMLYKVGIFDVDDILMNSIGSILGYLLFALCHKIYRKSTHSKKHRRERA